MIKLVPDDIEKRMLHFQIGIITRMLFTLNLNLTTLKIVLEPCAALHLNVNY